MLLLIVSFSFQYGKKRNDRVILLFLSEIFLATCMCGNLSDMEKSGTGKLVFCDSYFILINYILFAVVHDMNNNG